MILIIGGAYQGKAQQARALAGAGLEDCFICEMDSLELDSRKKVILYLEKFVFACLKEGVNPEERVLSALPDFKGAVVVMTDISSGVVPVDPIMREWREAAGRIANRLAKEARHVTRMFCSIAQVIK